MWTLVANLVSNFRHGCRASQISSSRTWNGRPLSLMTSTLERQCCLSNVGKITLLRPEGSMSHTSTASVSYKCSSEYPPSSISIIRLWCQGGRFPWLPGKTALSRTRTILICFFGDIVMRFSEILGMERERRTTSAIRSQVALKMRSFKLYG